MQHDLNSVQSKLKRLKYENEKLFVDCQSLREANQEKLSTHSSLATGHSSHIPLVEFSQVSEAKQMIKRLTGDIDLVESCAGTLCNIFTHRFGKSRELATVMTQIRESNHAMREVCAATKFSVPDDKH